MKLYCFQFSTGMVFRTTQHVLFTERGYVIDTQCLDTNDIPINGTIEHSTTGNQRKVTDMVFRSKDIVATWIEEEV